MFINLKEEELFLFSFHNPIYPLLLSRIENYIFVLLMVIITLVL